MFKLINETRGCLEQIVYTILYAKLIPILYRFLKKWTDYFVIISVLDNAFEYKTFVDYRKNEEIYI